MKDVNCFAHRPSLLIKSIGLIKGTGLVEGIGRFRRRYWAEPLASSRRSRWLFGPSAAGLQLIQLVLELEFFAFQLCDF